MEVMQLDRDHWRALREVRLRALREAPYAFGSTFDEESRQPDAWWQSAVEHLEWFEGSTVAWFMARRNDTPVGLVAGVFPVGTAGDSRVIAMWVDPEHRGTGLAGTLLEAVIRWCAERGARAVSLDVAEGNVRADRFYRRAGFAPTGRREPLYRDPSAMTEELRLDLGNGRPRPLSRGRTSTEIDEP